MPSSKSVLLIALFVHSLGECASALEPGPWRRFAYYGVSNSTPEHAWRDIDDGYQSRWGRRRYRHLFYDEFDYIGACPASGYCHCAPVHYQPPYFSPNPGRPFAGASWYRVPACESSQ